MTNSEYYLKEGISVDELADNFIDFCMQPTRTKTTSYMQDLKDFFKAQRKVILTEDERVILRNIDLQNFKAIGRENDYLYLRYTDYTCEYGETDIKTLTFWYMYHNLFKFIKNGEEYSIEELLKGDN